MRLNPITLPVTTTSTPYSSGDVVGGLLAFPCKTGQGLATLLSFAVFDSLNQAAALTLIFFKERPAGTYTDNAAFSWGAGDFALAQCPILIPAAAYTTVNSKAMANGEFKSGLYFQVPIAGDPPYLYAVCVTTGTPTYGANATTLRFDGMLLINDGQ